jgi:hypothetical protein
MVASSPLPASGAWDRLKALYDTWYGSQGDKTDLMWGFNEENLRANDLAFVLALAKDHRDSETMELLERVVEGYQRANERQQQMITRMQSTHRLYKDKAVRDMEKIRDFLESSGPVSLEMVQAVIREYVAD